MKFKARFVLNNAGACGQYKAIQGVKTRHIFYATGKAGFELRFEGTMAEYEILMKDIFSRKDHPCAIFIYPEIPDVSKLMLESDSLFDQNVILRCHNEKLEAELSRHQETLPVTSGAFEVPRTAVPVESEKTPEGYVEQGEPSDQVDVGLPVGPSSPLEPLAPKISLSPAGSSPKKKTAAQIKKERNEKQNARRAAQRVSAKSEQEPVHA